MTEHTEASANTAWPYFTLSLTKDAPFGPVLIKATDDLTLPPDAPLPDDVKDGDIGATEPPATPVDDDGTTTEEIEDA